MALRFFTAYRRLLLRLSAFASSHSIASTTTTTTTTSSSSFYLRLPTPTPLPATLLHFVGLVEVTNELDRERANSLRGTVQPMNGDFLTQPRFAIGVLYANSPPYQSSLSRISLRRFANFAWNYDDSRCVRAHAWKIGVLCQSRA